MSRKEINLDDIVDDRVYTAESAAKTIGRTKLTIYRWLESGKLHSENPGGHHRIRGSDLRKFLLTKPTRSRMKSKRIFVDGQEEMSFETWLIKAKQTGEDRLLPKAIDDIIDDRTYNTNKIAEMMGVGEAAVRIWVKSGKLKSQTPPGCHHAIRGSDLKQFMFERYVKKTKSS